MRRGVVVWMGCMVLAGLATSAWAEHELSEEELRLEMARNKTLSAYVYRNGMPDLAESRFLEDVGPWDDHEVTVYYLDRRKEIGFARAFLLGRPEVQIQRYQRVITDEEASALAERSRRWKGQIATAEHEREMAARTEAGPDTTAHTEAGSDTAAHAEAGSDTAAHAEADRNLGPDERAENAARRAEAAATRVESAALTTEQAADRTEAVVARMESAQATARPHRKKKAAAQAEKAQAPQAEKAPAPPDVVSQN
jgi:hypothetical protein